MGAAGELIDSAFAADAQLDNLPSKSKNAMGRGGMVSKIKAARIAAAGGAHTIIASGRAKDSIRNILHGQQVGTLLAATTDPLTARKRWIANQVHFKGVLVLDNGAILKLRSQGSSLLSVGVKSVEGNFLRGDIVKCVDDQGTLVAQGVINYSSDDARTIKGVVSERFSDILGYLGEEELVHRDNLIVAPD